MPDASPDNRTPAEVDADLALKDADLRLKELEAEEKRVIIRKELANALKEESNAAAYRLDLDRKQELRKFELAGDHYKHIFRFDAPVDSKTVDECIDRLTLWSRLEPGCDMEVIFNSPGGSVVAGMALFDFLLDLRRQGHRLTTTASGIAASMAGILLQAGDVRRCGREAWVLIHEASFGASGSFGKVEDQVEWVKRVQDRILDIFAARCAESGAEKPFTRAQLKKNWNRKDWWLSSTECLKHGVVDEVL